MTTHTTNPYEALERIFHEPNRLAIMSALCAADKGLTFNELKVECALTDGNLNRHLKTLEEVGAIRIEKAFVNAKPRTTVFISKTGLEHFSEYLEALSTVLRKARTAISADAGDEGPGCAAPAGTAVVRTVSVTEPSPPCRAARPPRTARIAVFRRKMIASTTVVRVSTLPTPAPNRDSPTPAPKAMPMP